MSSRSQRLQNGFDVYDGMTANAFDNRLNTGLAALEPNFPFLVDATMSYAIGDVWGHPGLGLRMREMAMVAMLGAAGASAAVQLRQHVGYALNFGVSGDDLREIVYVTSVTAGFPKALNMAWEMKTVFDERSVGDAAPEPTAVDNRHRDGLAKLAELEAVDHVDIAGHAALGPLARAFPFLVDSVIHYTMGAVWARAVLDGPTRQIAAVGSCAVLGDAWPEMRRHVAHALRLGVSRTTLSEVINLLTVAVGFPIALNAAAETRAAFDEEDHR